MTLGNKSIKDRNDQNRAGNRTIFYFLSTRANWRRNSHDNFCNLRISKHERGSVLLNVGLQWEGEETAQKLNWRRCLGCLGCYNPMFASHGAASKSRAETHVQGYLLGGWNFHAPMGWNCQKKGILGLILWKHFHGFWDLNRSFSRAWRAPAHGEMFADNYQLL